MKYFENRNENKTVKSWKIILKEKRIEKKNKKYFERKTTRKLTENQANTEKKKKIEKQETWKLFFITTKISNFGKKWK